MSRKLTILLTAAALTVSLVSCGSTDSGESAAADTSATAAGETQTADNSTGKDSGFSFETASEGEESSDNSADEGGFDFEKAIDSFYLEGVKIDLPVSKNGIPEPFGHDEDYYEYGSRSVTSIFRDETPIADLFYNDSPDKIDDDRPCDLFYIAGCFAAYDFYGIDQDSTEEEIISLWGEPDEIESKTVNKLIYRGKEPGQYVKVIEGSFMGTVLQIYFTK